ncbi:amidase [Bordetella pertussis]|nr:amidase [Bordetella pertussis]
MMQHYYERDGVRLSYYLDDYTDPWTQAPTLLLLLHGAMANAQRFYSWVPGLSRDYRVVRADLRGHGLSDVPPADKPLDLQVLTEDILALLDHLGCERVHLAGNSAGGYVGQHLAMQHPQRIETLALFGSAPGLRNSQASTWLERVAEKGLRQFLADTIDDRFPPELVGTPRCEQFLDALSDHDMAYIGRFVGYMAQQEWGDQLHRITCPTLVVIPGPAASAPWTPTSPCATTSSGPRSWSTKASGTASASTCRNAAWRTCAASWPATADRPGLDPSRSSTLASVMNIEQYVQQDGLALSAQLRAGATDPQALMQCAITLARQRAELLNALCYPDYDAALARAAAWRPTGVFGGLPFLLKDSGLACDRLPSSIGLALCKDMRFAGNAMLVERFDAAGLLPFARTTVPALCMAPTTEALVNGGPARNPWAPQRSAGGSSGGAAIAVATGVVPLAHGSDGGGSIRIPASCCGVFGLKPSRGLVPLGPARGEAWGGMAGDGVLSRSVRDTAAALDAIAGMERGAPYAAPASPAGGYLAALDQPFERPLRIGV